MSTLCLPANYAACKLQQCSCPVQIGAATPCRTLDFLKKSGFPADKALGAGVIDGRNIWADTGNAAALVAEIKKCTQAPIRVQVPLQPSLTCFFQQYIQFLTSFLWMVVPRISIAHPPEQYKVKN